MIFKMPGKIKDSIINSMGQLFVTESLYMQLVIRQHLMNIKI